MCPPPGRSLTQRAASQTGWRSALARSARRAQDAPDERPRNELPLAASASRALWLGVMALLLASCTRLPAPGDLEGLEALSRRDAAKRERALDAFEARMI